MRWNLCTTIISHGISAMCMSKVRCKLLHNPHPTQWRHLNSVGAPLCMQKRGKWPRTMVTPETRLGGYHLAAMVAPRLRYGRKIMLPIVAFSSSKLVWSTIIKSHFVVRLRFCHALFIRSTTMRHLEGARPKKCTKKHDTRRCVCCVVLV
jgi:hypothetical protein